MTVQEWATITIDWAVVTTWAGVLVGALLAVWGITKAIGVLRA